MRTSYAHLTFLPGWVEQTKFANSTMILLSALRVEAQGFGGAVVDR